MTSLRLLPPSPPDALWRLLIQQIVTKAFDAKCTKQREVDKCYVVVLTKIPRMDRCMVHSLRVKTPTPTPRGHIAEISHYGL